MRSPPPNLKEMVSKVKSENLDGEEATFAHVRFPSISMPTVPPRIKSYQQYFGGKDLFLMFLAVPTNFFTIGEVVVLPSGKVVRLREDKMAQVNEALEKERANKRKRKPEPGIEDDLYNLLPYKQSPSAAAYEVLSTKGLMPPPNMIPPKHGQLGILGQHLMTPPTGRGSRGGRRKSNKVIMSFVRESSGIVLICLILQPRTPNANHVGGPGRGRKNQSPSPLSQLQQLQRQQQLPGSSSSPQQQLNNGHLPSQAQVVNHIVDPLPATIQPAAAGAASPVSPSSGASGATTGQSAAGSDLESHANMHTAAAEPPQMAITPPKVVVVTTPSGTVFRAPATNSAKMMDSSETTVVSTTMQENATSVVSPTVATAATPGGTVQAVKLKVAGDGKSPSPMKVFPMGKYTIQSAKMSHFYLLL